MQEEIKDVVENNEESIIKTLSISESLFFNLLKNIKEKNSGELNNNVLLEQTSFFKHRYKTEEEARCEVNLVNFIAGKKIVDFLKTKNQYDKEEYKPTWFGGLDETVEKNRMAA